MKVALLCLLGTAMLAAVAADVTSCNTPFPSGGQGTSDNSMWWHYTYTTNETILGLNSPNLYEIGVPQPQQQGSSTLQWYQPGWSVAVDNAARGPSSTPPTINWGYAQGPFGQNVFCDSMSTYFGANTSTGDTLIGRPARTNWDRKTDIYLLGQFSAPANGFSGNFEIVVDNGLEGVWINGIAVTESDPQFYNLRSGCGNVDDPNNPAAPGVNWILSVPIGSGMLNQDGSPNLLAVWARDVSNAANTDPMTSTNDQSFLVMNLVYTNGYTPGTSAQYTTDGNCVCLSGGPGSLP